jgi:hypothetical protein
MPECDQPRKPLGPIRPGIEAFVGRETDAEFGGMAGQLSLHFPSDFPPPDAKPRGTLRYGWGRQVTARAVGTSFVLVTADSRGKAGMGRDLWEAEFAVCKTAGVAYIGYAELPFSGVRASPGADGLVVGSSIDAIGVLDW